MVLEGGTWSPGVFAADDLKDNFVRVTDSKWADTLFQIALAEDPLRDQG